MFIFALFASLCPIYPILLIFFFLSISVSCLVCYILPPKSPFTYVVYINSCFQAGSLYILCFMYDSMDLMLVELREYMSYLGIRLPTLSSGGSSPLGVGYEALPTQGRTSSDPSDSNSSIILPGSSLIDKNSLAQMSSGYLGNRQHPAGNSPAPSVHIHLGSGVEKGTHDGTIPLGSSQNASVRILTEKLPVNGGEKDGSGSMNTSFSPNPSGVVAHSNPPIPRSLSPSSSGTSAGNAVSSNSAVSVSERVEKSEKMD